MAKLAYLFIHPLLDPDDRWTAYLAESSAAEASLDAPLSALLNHPDWSGFDARHPWFVPAAVTALGPLPESVVPVFTMLPAEHPQAVELHEAEEALRQSGHPIALLTDPGHKLPATGAWPHLLISMSHARSLPAYTLLGQASRTGIVALDIHSHVDLTWARTNGSRLCSTEFLTMRNQQARKADVSRLKLLEVLGLIARDADTPEIEEVFREQPKLAYSLLRLVNSAANAPRSPVTCFSQAINLLGRRQLQRWLQLLVYAEHGDGKAATNPLLQKAATRGRLLELLNAPPAAAREHTDDIAFMVGAFSLLDALLNLPMNEILEQLPLPATVYQALAGHEGPLGQLLQAVAAVDARELPMAARLLERAGIAPETFLQAQVSALHWAAHIQDAA